MGIKSYRDLTVWQVAMELAEAAYRLTDGFPHHQQYGLSSQVQRAAVSVPANIAEGHGRDSTRQFLYHVSVAAGSLCELETHLMLAQRLDYASRDRIAAMLRECDRAGRMLTNLHKALKAKRRKRQTSDHEPPVPSPESRAPSPQ